MFLIGKWLIQRGGLIVLMIAAAAILAGLSGVDRDWTLFLNSHKQPAFTDIMSRSFFKGDRPGANDLVIVYLAIVLFIYFSGALRSGTSRFARMQPQAGFMLASALIIGVCLVHGLKWMVGRARPGIVLDLGLPFSHWYEFGPHFITEGMYRGSFPSSHTAQTFLLMALAYCLAGDPALRRSCRLVGWIIGVAVLAFTVTMAVARCMSLSHWLTDVAGSLLLGWVLLHWLYHDLFKVPRQSRYRANYGRRPPVPRLWELSQAAWFLLITIGVMLVVFGLRSLGMSQAAWLMPLAPIGAVLIAVACRRLAAVLNVLNTHLQSI